MHSAYRFAGATNMKTPRYLVLANGARLPFPTVNFVTRQVRQDRSHAALSLRFPNVAFPALNPSRNNPLFRALPRCPFFSVTNRFHSTSVSFSTPRIKRKVPCNARSSASNSHPEFREALPQPLAPFFSSLNYRAFVAHYPRFPLQYAQVFASQSS